MHRTHDLPVFCSRSMGRRLHAMPFAFYDLETTGTSPAYDQPLQFAAILTDDDLRPLERVNMRCRLAPHILPSPGALAITGIQVDQLTDPALPSWFEMMKEIQDLVAAWAPATWTGYNSMSFDENFLRQSFYQTLQPDVFATQFNGNTRLDVLQVLYAAHSRAPESLTWPVDDAGNAVFRLDALAPANGLRDHDAHDALGDVEATRHLLELVRRRAADLFKDILANRDKTHVDELLASGEPLEFVTRPPGAPPHGIVGCSCGRDAESANAAAFFDVRVEDPVECFGLDQAGLVDLLERSPRVVHRLKINETPMLFHSRAADGTVRERCREIADRPDFSRRVGAAMAELMVQRYPPPSPGESVRVEERIYDGFYGREDKQLLRSLNMADDWQARLSVVEQFGDARLQQLGRRAAVLMAPEIMPAAAVASAARNILARWRGAEASPRGWATLSAVHAQIDRLLQEGRIDDGRAGEIRNFYEARVRTLEANQMP
ncbi:MAG: exodeoxyribonuclease I [Boseongicola sp. SB0675_bin_26]|nr:exodeoxyribonuclease I [Boseongicola sp. SB0675_bin_26]